MFSAVPMVRVRIQVPAPDSAAATHAIARAGLLHLIDIAHGRADAAPPGGQALLAAHRGLRDRLRRTLDRLGQVAPPLSVAAAEPAIHDFDVERQRITAVVDPIEALVDRAWTARDAARGKAAGSARSLARAQVIAQAGVDIAAMASLRFVTASIVAASHEALASLSQFLSPMPHRVGSSRVDLQACKLEYSIVSPK